MNNLALKMFEHRPSLSTVILLYFAEHTENYFNHDQASNLLFIMALVGTTGHDQHMAIFLHLLQLHHI